MDVDLLLQQPHMLCQVFNPHCMHQLRLAVGWPLKILRLTSGNCEPLKGVKLNIVGSSRAIQLVLTRKFCIFVFVVRFD